MMMIVVADGLVGCGGRVGSTVHSGIINRTITTRYIILNRAHVIVSSRVGWEWLLWLLKRVFIIVVLSE